MVEDFTSISAILWFSSWTLISTINIQTTVHAARNIIESVIKNQNPYQYKINISIKQTA